MRMFLLRHGIGFVWFTRIKIAFDTVRIDNTYLNMCFFSETGIRIYFIALNKNSSNRIISRFTCILVKGMNLLNNCTVKVSYKQVLITFYIFVFRHGFS